SSRKAVVKAGKPVTAEQVSASLNAGRLLEAKQLAEAYLRHGGADAGKLLTNIEQRMKTEAVHVFARGSHSFRHEQLAKAIDDWSRAVALQPDEGEYREALHRAEQMQERLSVLRGKTESPPSTASEQQGVE
ncbi:MAG: hypothetical protein Q9M31_07575, partial [Mariprofundus sp.]|nr:hypothetical protein [Mariprofundus sp.]